MLWVKTMNEIVNVILFSNVINLFIVIIFLVWLFRKYNLLSYFYKKRDEIIELLKNLEQDRKTKESQLEATKTKVKNADQEVSKLTDDGEQVAEGISVRIIEEAEKEAASMQKKAQLTVESERKVATNEVIQEITTAAFATAETQINKSIDERLHRKYINDFINNLENLHE